MSDFDALLAEYTEKENQKVHGVICKYVDRNGKEVYSKIVGYDSVGPDAAPLREDAVLRLASATKLITSIALLQCVEKGLISLDESLDRIVPEFDNMQILTDVSGSDFTFEPNKTTITARHLLTHTAGLGYKFTNKFLGLWAEAQDDKTPVFRVPERYIYPLVFEPGTGWLYGSNLDWAGAVVSRLNNGMSLKDCFVKNVWKKLGLSSPFPKFNISTHPEYNARAMGGGNLTKEGKLEPLENWTFDNPEGQDGGSGLSCTTKDYVAVLADLISESPKLLKVETISEIFTPQLIPKSNSIQMLLKLRFAWNIVAGAVYEDDVNHGLGGVLCLGPVPEVGQQKNMLGWGGASNVVWWVNREAGVAGFFATQQVPFGNKTVTALVNAWKKDFWSQFNKID